MAGSVLLGPFLTRSEAARAAGVAPLDLVVRRDVLRIGGRSLEEVYFAFQFHKGGGVRGDVSNVVDKLADEWDHMTIAHWLGRPNSKLDSLSPLGWLDGGRDVVHVVTAAAHLASVEPQAQGAVRRIGEGSSQVA